MLDIFFLSYDEPNAEKNWRNLKSRFPHAKRVHGIRGIANAHIEACRKSNTGFFYVVDADAEILDTFDFKYKPNEYDAEYVHVWHAFNPATGLDYGYGGVKLFHKSLFKDIKNQLDFSTTLSKGLKVIPEIACITRFNSDPIRAFRGSFRESVKLFVTSNNHELSEEIKREARERLAAWVDPIPTCDYRQFIVAGATAGIVEARKRKNTQDDLLFINDHDLMLNSLKSLYPEIDLTVNPLPSNENLMKHELFFTTRISAILYDQYVLENMQLTELRDALSDGQLLSKNWVVETVSNLINSEKIITTKERKLKVVILGGWIGTLALMFNSWEIPFIITSVDIDERSNRIAEKLNYDFEFNTTTIDMYDLNYDQYDIIINTASEHIPDIPRWRMGIPENKIVIVQNNDFEEGAGHISTVKNSTELRKQLKLKEVFYEGTRSFSQYSRFMIIGKT